MPGRGGCGAPPYTEASLATQGGFGGFGGARTRAQMLRRGVASCQARRWIPPRPARIVAIRALLVRAVLACEGVHTVLRLQDAATNTSVYTFESLARCRVQSELQFLENVPFGFFHVLCLVLIGEWDVTGWHEDYLVEAPEGESEEKRVGAPVNDVACARILHLAIHLIHVVAISH